MKSPLSFFSVPASSGYLARQWATRAATALAVVSLLAPVAHAQTCAAPDSVAISGITNSTAVVRITPVDSSASYTVRYFAPGDSTAATTVTRAASALPIRLSGLRASAWYTAYVSTRCANGGTSAAVRRVFRTGGSTQTCATPTGLTATVTGPTSAAVRFAPVTGAFSYTVRYFAVGDSARARSITAIAPPVALDSLRPNTTYVVRVATNCIGGGTSAPATASFRIGSATACGGVTNITVTAASDSTARVNFTPGAGNTRFTVTYAAPGDSARTIASTTVPIVLTRLVPGRTYTVRITSLCGTGPGATATSAAPVVFSFRTSALSNAAALGLGVVSAYPNPAHGTISLVLPSLPGVGQAQLTLLNAMGQQVRSAATTLTPGGTQAQFDLTGIAPGLYTLRLVAGRHTASKHINVE